MPYRGRAWCLPASYQNSCPSNRAKTDAALGDMRGIFTFFVVTASVFCFMGIVRPRRAPRERLLLPVHVVERGGLSF